MKKTKVSINLMKPYVSSPLEALRGGKDGSIPESFHVIHPSQGGVFCYKESKESVPAWVSTFFLNAVNAGQLTTSSSSAVYILPVQVEDGQTRVFAISFGYGRAMLDKEAIEERFGLKIVLNLADDEALRQIKRTAVSGNSRKVSEQAPIKAGIGSFEIDIERDVLDGVTASFDKGGLLEGSVTGADVLSASISYDINGIDDFLRKIYTVYLSDSYKKNFAWVDQITPVKSSYLKRALDDEVLDLMRGQSPKVWMAVPEIVKWESLEGFRYDGSAEIYDDIELKHVWHLVGGSLEDLEQLKKVRIESIGAVNGLALDAWSAKECLYGEVDYKGGQYCLCRGKWYCIDKDFADRTNREYANSAISNLSFPNCGRGMKEAEYNHLLAEYDSSRRVMLDAKNISYGGGYSKVELCDVLVNDGTFIHNKRGLGSSHLSHLFNQGLVSATLVKEDAEFRKAATDKLSSEFKSVGFTLLPENVKEVVFGIIADADAPLPNIPFFSKISFNMVRRQLNAMGIEVSVASVRAA